MKDFIYQLIGRSCDPLEFATLDEIRALGYSHREFRPIKQWAVKAKPGDVFTDKEIVVIKITPTLTRPIHAQPHTTTES